MYRGTAESFLSSRAGRNLKGRAQLVLTSPPFPLNRKKQYGNLSGEQYLTWLGDLAPRIARSLGESGSLVIEMGNAWESGSPVMSTLGLEALMLLRKEADLHLCQQFVCHNPARLPTPIQWVNKDRIRVTDAYTHVWWMSKSVRPKANNRNVLRPYSARMEQLLARGKYNDGRRPSGHVIGASSFLNNNGGSIPSNVLSFSNTSAANGYRSYCREKGISAHPAAMAPGLAEFFIKFLTDTNDLVFDPFAGSNTTGAAAEKLGRKWVGVEPDPAYIAGSLGRFGV